MTFSRHAAGGKSESRTGRVVTSVALSAEQQALTRMVGNLVAAEGTGSPHVGQVIPFARNAWRAIVDAGLLGIGTDEGFGGSGGDSVDVALVVEALAAGPLAVPFLGSVLALRLLDAAIDTRSSTVAGALQRLKEEILAGRPAAIVLADDLRAPGRAGVVFDASDDCLVIGYRNGAVFAGETAEPLESVDLTRRLSRGRADGFLAATDGAKFTRWRAFALAMLSADLLGAMTATLTEATTHANERVQFDRPIGSFQAIQHLCADQLVTVESARSSVWHATWSVDALTPHDALSAARVAKAYCSSGALEVCEAAIQVLGGIGMTWECRAHLFLRRALLSRQVLGNESCHLAAIADDIIGWDHIAEDSIGLP